MKTLNRLQKGIMFSCGAIGEFAGLHMMAMGISLLEIVGFVFFLWGTFYCMRALQ